VELLEAKGCLVNLVLLVNPVEVDHWDRLDLMVLKETGDPRDQWDLLEPWGQEVRLGLQDQQDLSGVWVYLEQPVQSDQVEILDHQVQLVPMVTQDRWETLVQLVSLVLLDLPDSQGTREPWVRPVIKVPRVKLGSQGRPALQEQVDRLVRQVLLEPLEAQVL
jgi:hypothetical protein